MKKNSITVSLNGIDFAVRFSYPNAIKNSPTPCRALVTPISPETGRLLTNRQLSGKESDCIVDRPVYGKSPEDIRKNHIEPVIQNLLFEMQTAGLIDDIHTQKDVQDLASIAAEFEETFFELHKNEWKSSTISSYRGQYNIHFGPANNIDFYRFYTIRVPYGLIAPQISKMVRNGKCRVKKAKTSTHKTIVHRVRFCLSKFSVLSKPNQVKKRENYVPLMQKQPFQNRAVLRYSIRIQYTSEKSV